jgi:GGDEF domain-containing protein
MGRFIKAVERIRLALKFNVGASIGLATLAEVDGDIEKWVSLADSRMYEEKQSKR